MSLALPLVLALALCLAVEAVADPGIGHAFSRRPSDLAIRLGSYALIAVFWFVFSWRPWLAAATTVGTVLTTVLVDRLKRKVLGESLVFSDLALIGQVPQHPELYYTTPLTHPRAVGPVLVLLGAVALWYRFEPAALPQGAAASLTATLGLPLALAALALSARTALGRRIVAVRFPAPDFEADVARYGVLATIMAYTLRRDAEAAVPLPTPAICPRHRALSDDVDASSATEGAAQTRTGVASDRLVIGGDAHGDEIVVVVQLESFLDPERLGGSPLPLMTRIRDESLQYGRLRVPAHGAYTMRSEHAVLTGRNSDELGFGRFDPYLAFRGRDPESLARLARGAGYRTVFVHPYHPDFFRRAAVMRALGFDQLVMQDEFAGAPRVGPYVADAAVAERILAELRRSSGPILVFCATMENHGPWRLGRLQGIDDPLAQYRHHVANSGRAMGHLIDALSNEFSGRSATLCLYGDHPPSLPCYRPDDGDLTTDYAIFRFGADAGRAQGRQKQVHPPHRIGLTAAALGRRLRDTLGPEAAVPPAPVAQLPRS